VQRWLGAALLLLVLLPIHAWTGPGDEGSPAAHLTALAQSYYTAMLLGGIGILVVSIPLGFLRAPGRAAGILGDRLHAALIAPSGWAFALGMGLAAGALTVLISVYAFDRAPVLLDGVVQIVHARYLAAGKLAGPVLESPEFTLFQYTVHLPTGWASQYPPGHAILLALGFLAGVPWLVGPVLAAATVALTARVAEELLPDRRVAARLGTVILAASPFFLSHAATYMNHVTAAAFGTFALWAALRGTSDRRSAYGWVAAAGCAAGATFATRPLSGAVMGVVAAAALLVHGRGCVGVDRRGRRQVIRLLIFAAACLLPVAGVLVYNQILFGGATRFGYLVAEGPGHGLGFHTDPWGNPYGPLDALVQTSRYLLALGMDLFPAPLSLTALIGIFLVWRPAHSGGMRLILLWAALPLVAQAFYWHQDLFIGPRLLNEFAPAWAILSAVAAVELLRGTRQARPTERRRFDRHAALSCALALSAILAAAWMTPRRVAHYAQQWGAHARTPVPAVAEPALIFVHEAWSERLGARLAAWGLRADSIRAVLRHNTSCEVHNALDAMESGVSATAEAGPDPVGATEARPWDRLRFRAEPALGIREAAIRGGTTVRTRPGEQPGAECLRQAHADRYGTVPLPELLWRGDLPGLETGGIRFVRDLGPELNRKMLRLESRRRPWVYARTSVDADPVLLSYDEAMERLWSGADAVGAQTPR
jgi:hypothetical protein